MKKNITLKDIAAELNVSTTTVSKALKDYADISQDTKNKVKKLVDEWGYFPNSMAVNLRNKRTGIIGVIIPEIVHHFFSTVISGIMEEAEKSGFMVMIFQSNEKVKTEIKQCGLFKQYHIDGLLISLSNKTENRSHLKDLQDCGIHIVQFDKISDLLKTSKVVIDDYEAAFEITEHLIKSKPKKIIHIAGPILPRNAKERLKGYRDALLKHAYKFDTDRVYRTVNSTEEEGYIFAKKTLKEHPDVDAIFCVTDMLAIGTIRALKEAGKKVPEDVCVAGFSNWFLSSVVTPTITTIDQPGEFMGKEATKLLIEEIKRNDENGPKKKIMIPTELVIRESTKNSQS